MIELEFETRPGIAVPLNVRNMDWELLCETVCRMDAAFECTRRYSHRVTGDRCQFMFRMT